LSTKFCRFPKEMRGKMAEGRKSVSKSSINAL